MREKTQMKISILSTIKLLAKVGILSVITMITAGPASAETPGISRAKGWRDKGSHLKNREAS
jgi:hypothetical protein